MDAESIIKIAVNPDFRQVDRCETVHFSSKLIQIEICNFYYLFSVFFAFIFIKIRKYFVQIIRAE